MDNKPDYDQILSEALDKVKADFKALKKINIIIAGKSGVGKSTLINAAFGAELAQTGIGRPVTDKISLIETASSPIRIYDTVGLELNPLAQWKSQLAINKIVKQSRKTEKIEDDIHCLWYCINATGRRVDGEELKFMKHFMDLQIPVILVLTNAASKQDAQDLSVAIHQDLPSLTIVPVLAKKNEFVDAYGLETLVEKTGELLPEALQNSFANAQKPSFDLKRKQAAKVVRNSAAVNFGTGFVPIPLADAPLMMATESTMLAKITTIYDVDTDKFKVETALGAAMGILGAIAAGKSVSTSLFKLVPGVGTLVGGSISGTVGATITVTLGYAYMELMELVLAGKINLSEVTPDEISEVMVNLVNDKISSKTTEIKRS